MEDNNGILTEETAAGTPEEPAEEITEELTEEPAEEPAGEPADNLFEGLRLRNPYTGAEVRTRSDFLEWKRRYLESAEEEESNLPHKEAAPEEPVPKAEPPAKAAEPAEAVPAVDISDVIQKELAKIQRWDESVRTLTDIARDERFNEIYSRLQRGYDLSDAFYLTHAGDYLRQTAEKAEQETRNRLAGKEHLRPLGAAAGEEEPLSQAEAEEFRRLLPGATDDEIRAFCRRDSRRAHK